MFLSTQVRMATAVALLFVTTTALVNAVEDSATYLDSRLVSHVAPPASSYKRRSLDAGRAARLHRVRRSLYSSLELPRPMGTAGAKSEAENILMLDKVFQFLSEMNTDWQKAANKELAKGQEAESFDQYEKNHGIKLLGDDSKNTPQTDASVDNTAPQSQNHHGVTTKKQNYDSQQQNDSKHHSETYTKPPKKQEDYPKMQSKVIPGPESKPVNTSPQPQPPTAPPKKIEKHHSSSKGSSAAAGSKTNLVPGKMTFYDVGLNACGKWDQPSDYIVAVAQSWWDEAGGANPNNSPMCGRQIYIEKGGINAVAKVTDICPSCEKEHIDMSRSLFEHFDNLDVGLDDVKWKWLN